MSFFYNGGFSKKIILKLSLKTRYQNISISTQMYRIHKPSYSTRPLKCINDFIPNAIYSFPT